jgi:hypothetical protein
MALINTAAVFLRPGFVGVSIKERLFIYQCLTSVRYTQKQSETTIEISSQRQSDTVFTTAPIILHRKSLPLPCTTALLSCQLNPHSLALPVCIHTFTIAQNLWLLIFQETPVRTLLKLRLGKLICV